MTLCPYALVLSCGKCPIKAVCPLKSVIGDAKKPIEKSETEEPEKNNEN
jgi:hypothetical protein